MKIKHCLPIQPKSLEDTLNLISSQLNRFHYFEVWIDYLEDKALEFINKISSKLKERLILIFRRKNWDKTYLTDSSIKSIIQIAVKNECLIDFDIVNQPDKLLEFHTVKGIKLITSFHDYEATPDNCKIDGVVNTMQDYNPFIFKIACMCRGHKDAYRLLSYCFNFKEQNRRFIVLGMGNFGKVTRIAGTLWGNELAFSPLSSELETAPQQITKEQLDTIFNII